MFRITKSSKNLLLSIDVAKVDEVGIVNSGGDYENKKIKKSPSKNLNGASYLTPDAKKAFNHLRHAFTKAPIF